MKNWSLFGGLLVALVAVSSAAGQIAPGDMILYDHEYYLDGWTDVLIRVTPTGQKSILASGIGVQPGAGQGSMALMPNGSVLFYDNEYYDNGWKEALIEYNPATQTKTIRATNFGFQDSAYRGDMALNPDGNPVFWDSEYYDNGWKDVIGQVDLDTGAKTLLAKGMGVANTANRGMIAYTSSFDKAYIYDNEYYLSGWTDVLMEVDLNDGSTQIVASGLGTQPSSNMGRMFVRNNGNVLIYDHEYYQNGWTDAFIEIDVATGTKTVLSTGLGLGLDGERGQMDLALDGGIIYYDNEYYDNGWTDVLMKIDPDSGTKTILASGIGAVPNDGMGYMAVSRLALPEFTGGNNVTIGATTQDMTGQPDYYSTALSASLSVSELLGTLASADGSVRTGFGGANNQPGNLTLAVDLDFEGLGSRSLLLRASNDINIDADILDSAPDADTLHLQLIADNPDSSTAGADEGGDLNLNAAIALGAGHLNAQGENLNMASSASITTTGDANMTFTGDSDLAGLVNANSLTLSTTAATVSGTVSVAELNVDSDTFDHADGSIQSTDTATLTAQTSMRLAAALDADTLNVLAPAVTVEADANVSAASATFSGGALNVTDGSMKVISVDLSGVGNFSVSGGLFQAGSLDLTQPGAFNFTDGTVRVDGGTLTAPGVDLLINGATGDPTVELTQGAVSVVDGAVRIGTASAGTLKVLSASELRSDSAQVGTSGTGLAVVSGSASTWQVTGQLTVGAGGEVQVDDSGVLLAGTVDLTAGGTLTMGQTASIQATDIHTADHATLNFAGGTLTVATPVWDLAGTVSLSGQGTVDARVRGGQDSVITANGGNLVMGDATSLKGFSTAGDIVVEASAGLTLNARGFAELGYVTTLNGGTLEATNGVVLGTGRAIQGSGSVAGAIAADFGSSIYADGDLALGNAAAYDGFYSDGRLFVAGNEVALHDQNIAVLGSLTDLDGGRLVAANGSLLREGNNLTGNGSVAGDFVNQGNVNGDGQGGPLVFEQGYTASGKGSYNHVVFNGHYSPGNSPEVVTSEGASWGATGSLTLEIGGLTPGEEHDQIIFLGDAPQFDGQLSIELIYGFTPEVGQVFQVFDFQADGLGVQSSGQFATIQLAELAAGLSWDTSGLYTDGTVGVVPEPGTMALLALGGLAALRRRRS